MDKPKTKFQQIVLLLGFWFFRIWNFLLTVNKRPPRMAVSGAFMLGYGVFRFFCEFFRAPDPQLGFVAFDWMTPGQELCIPMILIGLVLLTLAYRKGVKS